jgi:hypothetical protein
MAIQEAFGKLGGFEDFQGIAASASVADATTGTRVNDITLVAIGTAVTFTYAVDESGGVASFQSADNDAASGMALLSSPMVPSSNGTLVVVGRWKASVVTDFRAFLGWQETASLADTVNPFTLSGTNLTANNGGQVVGFYFDGQATTDDLRFMASSDGTASTTATVTAREGSTTLGALGILSGATVATDSWITARVEIDPDGTARGYAGVAGMGRQTGLTLVATLKQGALDADAVYHPHLHLAQHSTGGVVHKVDYFGATGHRDWTL